MGQPVVANPTGSSYKQVEVLNVDRAHGLVHTAPSFAAKLELSGFPGVFTSQTRLPFNHLQDVREYAGFWEDAPAYRVARPAPLNLKQVKNTTAMRKLSQTSCCHVLLSLVWKKQH